METEVVPRRSFTRQEFHAWTRGLRTSDRNRYELLDGRIAVTPPAGWPHSRLAARIVARLVLHVETRGLGEVLESSAGYDLPSGDCVQPDASFFSRETLGRGPAPVEGKSLAFAPDLVVEVLSPSTRRRDLGKKRAIYARNGVAEYWVVDPVGRSITVFARGEDAPRGDFDGGTKRVSGLVPSRLLPDLELSIELLFA